VAARNQRLSGSAADPAPARWVMNASVAITPTRRVIDEDRKPPWLVVPPSAVTSCGRELLAAHAFELPAPARGAEESAACVRPRFLGERQEDPPLRRVEDRKGRSNSGIAAITTIRRNVGADTDQDRAVAIPDGRYGGEVRLFRKAARRNRFGPRPDEGTGESRRIMHHGRIVQRS